MEPSRPPIRFPKRKPKITDLLIEILIYPFRLIFFIGEIPAIFYKFIFYREWEEKNDEIDRLNLRIRELFNERKSTIDSQNLRFDELSRSKRKLENKYQRLVKAKRELQKELYEIQNKK